MQPEYSFLQPEYLKMQHLYLLNGMELMTISLLLQMAFTATKLNKLTLQETKVKGLLFPILFFLLKNLRLQFL